MIIKPSKINLIICSKRTITIKMAYDKYEPKQLNKKMVPILIAHGLFGSKQNWKTMAKNLSQKLNTNVYALDLRNHGESPHNSDMSYISISEDIKSFIDDLKIKKVNLIGHSLYHISYYL